MATTRSVFQVVTLQVQAGQTVANVLHYKTVLDDNSTLPTNFMSQFAIQMGTLWNSQIRPMVTAQLQHFRVEVTEITAWQVVAQPGTPSNRVVLILGDRARDETFLGTPGAIAGDPLPTTVAAVVDLRTLLAGRRNRGRVKQGGLLEVDNGPDGRVTPTARGVIDTAWENYRQILIPSTPVLQVNLSVFSKTKLLTQAPGTNIRLAAEAVAVAKATAIWGQQRTRRQRDGGA